MKTWDIVELILLGVGIILTVIMFIIMVCTSVGIVILIFIILDFLVFLAFAVISYLRKKGIIKEA